MLFMFFFRSFRLYFGGGFLQSDGSFLLLLNLGLFFFLFFDFINELIEEEWIFE